MATSRSSFCSANSILKDLLEYFKNRKNEKLNENKNSLKKEENNKKENELLVLFEEKFGEKK